MRRTFVAAMACALCSTHAAAQEPAVSLLDLIQDCDILAAHPDDAQRMADGIADDKIVPRLAIAACENATKENSSEARFVFQLGRAQLAAGQKEKAVEQFRKAADSGYAAGPAYLGDAYQFGYGVKLDPAQARNHYAEALKGGFARAEGQIEMLTFDPSNYAAAVVGKLYGGDIGALRANDGQVRNYVYSFVTALAQECGLILEPPSVQGL